MSAFDGIPVLEAGPVCVRHVRKALSGESGGTLVLSTSFLPQPLEGLNGQGGWVGGGYELRLNEEGTFTLRVPNAPGADGVEHFDRFLVTSQRGAYQPGDEWLEIYDSPYPTGDPVFVGTPTGATLTLTGISIKGVDALGYQRKTRETAAGFWKHAPRDLVNNYGGAWVADIADGFSGTTLNAAWGVDATVAGDTVTVKNGQLNLLAKGTTVGRNLPTTPALDDRVQIDVTLDSFDLPSGAQKFKDPTTGAYTVTGTAGSINTGIFLTCADGVTQYYLTLDYYASTADDPVDGGVIQARLVSTNGTNTYTQKLRDVSQPCALRLELSRRWVYGYVNGRLVGVVPRMTGLPTRLKLYGNRNGGSGATKSSFLFGSVLLRVLRPLLTRSGVGVTSDYHLPGLPPAGGLQGEYYDDYILFQRYGAGAPYLNYLLDPTRRPYARRLDPNINYTTSANPSTWMPQGTQNGGYVTVVWTGSIYLPLGTTGHVTLGMNNGNGFGYIFVGDLRDGYPIASGTGTFSGSTGAQGMPAVTGWYPIRIELTFPAPPTYPGIFFINTPVAYNDLGGTAVPSGVTTFGVPPTSLSPVGVVNQQVRYDSHYEQIKSTCDQFGLQFTCLPRSLESGAFPGIVVARVRQGRDTELVLTPDASSEIQDEIDATNAISTLLVDAAGLAADGAQITQEGINFGEVTNHLSVQSDYTSLSDITVPNMALQRANSLIALRSAPFEQVSLRPQRKRDFLDSFPLTGNLAKFRWAPGDGLRLGLPRVGVVDRSARQILGASWEITPGGHKAPAVSFRQRPRSRDQVLRDIARTNLLQQRTFQGQLAVVSGSIGATNGTGGGGADTYTRLNWPTDGSKIVRVEFVIQTASITVSYTIEVNGNNVIAGVSGTGRYDVTNFARVDGFNPRCFARLVGGTGNASFALEAVVRV